MGQFFFHCTDSLSAHESWAWDLCVGEDIGSKYRNSKMGAEGTVGDWWVEVRYTCMVSSWVLSELRLAVSIKSNDDSTTLDTCVQEKPVFWIPSKFQGSLRAVRGECYAIYTGIHSYTTYVIFDKNQDIIQRACGPKMNRVVVVLKLALASLLITFCWC